MPIRELTLRIRVIVERDQDGLMAHCPELSGLAVEAPNMEELKMHMKDAVEGYVESLLKHGDPIPIGVLESDEEHSVVSFLFNKLRKRFGIPLKTQEYIQDIRYSDNHNHAAA